MYTFDNSNDRYSAVVWKDNTVTWYSASGDVNAQLNAIRPYFYVALMAADE